MQPVGQESLNTEVHFDVFFHETIVCFLSIRIQNFALYFLSTKTDVRQMSGRCQAVVRQSSGSGQEIVRQSSSSRRALVRQSGGSHQDSGQTVV